MGGSCLGGQDLESWGSSPFHTEQASVSLSMTWDGAGPLSIQEGIQSLLWIVFWRNFWISVTSSLS